MTKEEFIAWRKRFGLSQTDVANRYGLTRNTIQNWETGKTALPQAMEGACLVWEDRLKKDMAEIGPLTLIYSDAPMFIDPYRPRGRVAQLRQEPFPTNAAALARVQFLWGRDDFHGPFIIDKDNKPLWNRVELMRVIDGNDKTAPTLANTIRKVADYVRANAQFHARDGARAATAKEAAATKRKIEAIADELDDMVITGAGSNVRYSHFEERLAQLHDLGFFPPNKMVSDVAHAALGNELAAQS
jgi:hypothetical protein